LGVFIIRKNKFRSVFALSVFLILIFVGINTKAVNIKKENISNNNDILTIDLGSMKMEYVDDPDQNYVDISFNTPSKISDTTFEIGQTIRLEASWQIIEGGLRQDYWNFSIYRVNLHYGCASWATITPENDEGWYNDVEDRAGRDDDQNGTIYFDFTPTRQWFCPAWHNIGGDSDEFINSIVLRCEYKNKGWLSTKWNTTIEDDKLEDNWYLAYENSAPTITDYEITTDGKKLTIEMDVEDPDYTPSSGQGDFIGVTIDWGDGTTTDTGFWDDKNQIYNGFTTVSKTHTYDRRGTYTITAKVKDWYNAGFHEYSNEISEEAEVIKSKSIEEYSFINFIKQLPFFEKMFDFFEKIDLRWKNL